MISPTEFIPVTNGISPSVKLFNGIVFSLPSGIGILSKLWLLTVQECGNLVSIPELPSNLEHLDTFGCKSMQWVRLPIQAKNI